MTDDAPRDPLAALRVVEAARKMRAARERKAMAGSELREAIVAEERLYVALDVIDSEGWNDAMDYADQIENALDATRRSGDKATEGETWRCPSCHDTTAPMGMCQKCGVFGTRQEARR